MRFKFKYLTCLLSVIIVSCSNDLTELTNQENNLPSKFTSRFVTPCDVNGDDISGSAYCHSVHMFIGVSPK